MSKGRKTICEIGFVKIARGGGSLLRCLCGEVFRILGPDLIDAKSERIADALLDAYNDHRRRIEA